MSIITISSIFNFEYDDYKTYCNTVISDFITTTPYEDTLDLYIYLPIWLRYRDTPIKFSNDDKGKDAFLRNFNNQLTEVVFDFHNYAKENIDYFLYQNDTTKQGKPMSKTITSGIAPINQKIDQALDSTNLASGTGSQFVSETVYNGVAWHKLVEGYFTPNRKTTLLKAFQWLFVSVYSPETRYDDKIEEKRYVELSFVDDDNNIIDEQKVLPTKSYYTMSEVNIQRPLMLDPQNVKKDVDIAGVVGTYEPNIYPEIHDNVDLTQAKTYNTPSGYDGIGKVVITPPSTALPENIKDGINIGGVVGTYVGGADTLGKRITADSNPYNYIDNTITTMQQYAFTYDSNIRSFTSNSLTKLNGNSFSYSGLTSISCSEVINTNNAKETFLHCNDLTSVNLPKVNTIGNYCFAYCGNLTNISLPLLETCGTYAFSNSGLTTVNLPLLKTAGGNSFSSCNSLTSITLPELTQVQGSLLFNCANLQSISLPKAISITSNANFAVCPNLTTVNLPLAASIGQYAFYNDTALVTISLPKLVTAPTRLFDGCTNLTTINYGENLSTMNSENTYRNCSSLSDIYLPRTSVVSTSTTIFDGLNQVINIHVPSNLISTYQTATNWSTLYNNGKVVFVAI